MNCHDDAPNSHIPAINLLEFLVHALSITLSYQIANLQSMDLKVILYLQKILSIYWQLILGMVTDNNSVEINTNLKIYNTKVD